LKNTKKTKNYVQISVQFYVQCIFSVESHRITGFVQFASLYTNICNSGFGVKKFQHLKKSRNFS